MDIRPGLVINARLGSKRCRNKMLRPFAGTTLIEIALEKLDRLDTDLPRYFGAGEPELIELAAKFPNVTPVRRPPEALDCDGPPSRVLSHLLQLPEKWFVTINPCLPLVPGELWLEAAEELNRIRPKSLTAVFRNQGWFYARNGASLNCLSTQVNATQDTPWVHEVAHAFHVLERDRFFAMEKPWKNEPMDPWLLEIPRDLCWDVDTEDQFLAAEAVYAARVPAPVFAD